MIFFVYVKVDDNLILVYLNVGICEFWIEYGWCICEIVVKIGVEFGFVVVNNIWVLDGMKDFFVDWFVFWVWLEVFLDVMLVE